MAACWRFLSESTHLPSAFTLILVWRIWSVHIWPLLAPVFWPFSFLFFLPISPSVPNVSRDAQSCTCASSTTSKGFPWRKAGFKRVPLAEQPAFVRPVWTGARRVRQQCAEHTCRGMQEASRSAEWIFLTSMLTSSEMFSLSASFHIWLCSFAFEGKTRFKSTLYCFL